MKTSIYNKHLAACAILLSVFGMTAASCSDDNSSENEQMSGCTSNAQCAGRLDGKTQCDAVNGVCVAPDATPECALNGNCSSPNTAPDVNQTPEVSKCNEDQEWSAQYQTCVYPINSQSDYEGYVAAWNTSGKAAFPGINDEKPAFLLKTDDIRLEEKAAWGTEANPFEAAFYGDNHTIALYGEREGQRLFGYTNSAEIQDVKINLIKNTLPAYRTADAFIAKVANHSRFNNIEVTGYWKLGEDSGYGMFEEVNDSELENIKIDIEMNGYMAGSSSFVSTFLNKSNNSVYRNISLNGKARVTNYNTDFAGLAFDTNNDKWENCEINIELGMGEPVYNEKTNYAYLLFKRMSGNTTVDRMNISKLGVTKTKYTSAMLVYDARSCTDCVISNLEDNTNYSERSKTYFIKYNYVAESTSSGANTGLTMYNILINSNYNIYNESKTPFRVANVLFQNRNEKESNFGDASVYPFVYDKSDIDAKKVTVGLLNDNIKSGVLGDNSYLPWGQDSKGRFYLKFDDSADEGSDIIPDASMCTENQEWSDKYKTCVYPINAQADYEKYVTEWNANGKAAFPGIGNDDPVFLLKTDDVSLSEKDAWGTPGSPFEAVFYGDNHTINLYGVEEGERLFGHITYAEIQDLKINLVKNTIPNYRRADAFIAKVAKHSRFNNIEVTGYWEIGKESGYGMFEEVEDSRLENININIEMKGYLDLGDYLSPFLNKSTRSVYRNISLNGKARIGTSFEYYAGLAFDTEDDRWENCEINLDLTIGEPYWKENGNTAYLMFRNMKGKTVVDRMNISKMDVTKTKYTYASLIYDTRACTDCTISNLQDNTNYSETSQTHFISHSYSYGSTSSKTDAGLSMYNILINSNYDSYIDNSETPVKVANVLIPNLDKTKWDFANALVYPYVYDKTDIAAGKVTVNLLNNNLKAGIVKSGSYLPWAQDDKGRFYLKFNAADSEIRVIP